MQELLQLRKQNRRNTAQIQTLEAMQAKQNAVLQRKIADAAAARKKLKELQVRVGGSSRCGHCFRVVSTVLGLLDAAHWRWCWCWCWCRVWCLLLSSEL